MCNGWRKIFFDANSIWCVHCMRKRENLIKIIAALCRIDIEVLLPAHSYSFLSMTLYHEAKTWVVREQKWQVENWLYYWLRCTTPHHVEVLNIQLSDCLFWMNGRRNCQLLRMRFEAVFHESCDGSLKESISVGWRQFELTQWG